MDIPYKMNNVLFLPLFLAILFLACDKDSSRFDLNRTKAKEDCITPYNPFNDGGGHDAGFNWAQEKGGYCNGNSDSFNEGCEEYFSQLDKYNECLANNSK